MRPLPPVTSISVSIATALVLLVVAVTPFLTPAWVSFEQGRADAATWTGFGPNDLRTATDAILGDLVMGPPSFDVAIGGQPVLTDGERSHMRDVRRVFMGFYLAGAAALTLLVSSRVAARRLPGWSGRAFWSAVRVGALGLLVGTAVAGIVSVVAFDAAFEAFHELFFPAGTFLFDPRTDRLVQLFPDQFWSETSIAVGVVAAGLAVVTIILSGSRRDRQPGPSGPGG